MPRSKPSLRGVCLLWLLLYAAHALAQSSASFQIPRQSIDGGASHSSSASYGLVSSIGQPDAARASSASFELNGGFLKPVTSGNQPENLFRNGFE